MPHALISKVVLVTGAGGFIGRHLAARLACEEGVELVLLARTQGDGLYPTVTSDLESLSSRTWDAVGVPRIDVVFHVGGFIPKSAGEANDIARVFNDNLAGTRALLDSFPRSPERVVFFSTVDVYKPPEDRAVLTESSPIEPVSLYAASKFFCEQLIRAHASSSGYACSILRLGHVTGPGEMRYRKVVPETLRRLLRGDPPVIYGDGTGRRDMLYVDDAVEAAMRAAVVTAPSLGPVNVVSGESRSIKEIVELLADLWGWEGRVEHVNGGSGGYSLQFDNSRMRKDLGEWALVPWREGLRRTVEWFRECV